MSTLSDSDLAKGLWMACDHPERPDDAKCCYHLHRDRRCRGCQIALQAAAANGARIPEAWLGHWKDEQ